MITNNGHGSQYYDALSEIYRNGTGIRHLIPLDYMDYMDYMDCIWTITSTNTETMQ